MMYRQKYEKEYPKRAQVDSALVLRLIKYLLPYKKIVLLAILILLAAKSIEAFVPIYIGKMSQTILSSYSLSGSKKMQLFSYVAASGGIIFSFLLLLYAGDAINVFLKNWIGQKGVFSLRTEIFHHIQRMPLSFYNRNAVGSLMTRVIHDVDQIDQMLSESAIPLIGSLLLFLLICVGLLIVDYKVGAIYIVIFPAAFWLTNYFRIHQRRCYDNVRSIVSAMNAFVQEHLMGASTIRSFGLHDQERRYFEEINQDHRDANVETIRYFALFFAGIDFIQSITLILVFVVIMLFASPGEFNAGIYFTFSLYTIMLFRPLSDLAERYNVLQSAMAAAERIFYVLDQKTEDYSKPIDEPALKEIERIEFEDVWFAYKEENWVLRGFNLTIQRGQTVAIVGITGAGKTTLLNILLRFYEFQKGTIKLNGIDIRKFSLETIRGKFSVVLQDPEIFSGSLKDNISMYQAQMPRWKIDAAIDYVNLQPVIARLPHGIDTILQERGKSLSAGEQQLVSLARAVAHDRNVFILDEATANIDSGNEAIIKRALQKIFEDKTALVIAHRLSTIKEASKIVVIHQGVASEVGTHQELLVKKGIYEKLYRLQYLA